MLVNFHFKLYIIIHSILKVSFVKVVFEIESIFEFETTYRIEATKQLKPSKIKVKENTSEIKLKF